MKKSFSIAQAKNELPKLVHSAEHGQIIELTRRGRPVAVILSLQEYQALNSEKMTFSQALAHFQASDVFQKTKAYPEDFQDLRSPSVGRDFVW